jgi:hypothetical protein
MEPSHLRFGGGSADTHILPFVAVYLLIAIVLILVLPRSKAIVPFLLAFFTIPIAQVLVLGGFHFTALRVLILAGLVRRACSRKPPSGSKFPGGFNAVDWVVVLWAVSAQIMYSLQYKEMQAFVYALGVLLDSLGGYLVVRFLIPDGEALRRTIKVLAAICVINAVGMVNEKISHVNVFSLLGETAGVTIRDGHVRAGGVMGCLYAGAFAGVLIPVFLWLWNDKKSRVAACAGLAGATVMVITSYSSTSYLAFGGSVVGLAFWPLRKQMRLVRWGLVSMLVGLQLVMKAPVWALIARMDLTGSSSGDQRYHLVDMCIRNFSRWWLMGTTSYNTWGWDSWDLVNQFVAVALTGGLITLIFYIMIFKRSFGALGSARKLVNGDRHQEWALWCLGSALFAHVVAHFGINYMAQLIMGLFPLLAFISVATFEARQETLQTAEAPAQQRFALVPRAVGKYAPPLGQARQEAPHGSLTRRRERFTPSLKA